TERLDDRLSYPAAKAVTRSSRFQELGAGAELPLVMYPYAVELLETRILVWQFRKNLRRLTMKNLFTRSLTLLGLMVVGLAMTAAAQSSAVIKANIPFDFNFAGKTFPAGEYSLVQPIQHVLALRDSRKQIIAQTLTGGIESITPEETTKL